MSDTFGLIIPPNKSLKSALTEVYRFVDEETDYPEDTLYLWLSASTIAETLRSERAAAEVSEPWERLSEAFETLMEGTTPDLFKPQRRGKTGRPFLHPRYARNMAYASAAVTLAPRGEQKDVLRKAARILGVQAKQLHNFRKNLMRRRIGGRIAGFTYSSCINGEMAPVEGGVELVVDPKKRKRATSSEWLRLLEPVKPLRVKRLP